MGDGSNTWSALSYFKNLEDLGGLDDFVLYTEIGASNDPANYTRTAPLNEDGLIPLAYMAKLVEGANANLDTFAELGSAIDQLNQHADETVGPHGISDTSNLAYLDDSRFTDERTPEDLSVITGKIADSAVTAVKIADLAIGTSKIADNAVTTAKINDGNVTEGKLATDSVTTIKIADNAVTNDKIADDAVTATQLATSAVETLKINDLAVTTAKIDNSSVTSGKIAVGAVETTNIADSAVTADKIEAGAVGSSELATSAVETLKINDLAVTDTKIAAAAVTSSKIADAAVTGSKIADNAISQSHLGDDSVGTNEIGGLAVTTEKIAALAVTDAKIAADAVTTAKVADLAITSAKINDDAVTSLKIADNAVETAHILDSNVTAGKLATDSVTTVKIADGAVTSAKILAGAVGSSELATDSVETAKIADGAVTSAKIAAGTIVDSDISASAAIAQSKIDGLSASLSAKADLASPTFTGTVVLPTVTAGGSIVPGTDNTYDLGSPTKMWKDIYVGPGSLYVNGQKVLQDESGAIVVSADVDENLGLRTSGSGNIELDPTGTGSVNIKGPLVVEAGANFSSADGNGIAFSNGIKSNSLESNSLNTDLSLSGNGTGKVYLNDNAEVNGNLVVGGNLTVSGTTTTVNSETISLADNIIDLNSNFTTGIPTENSGIRIMRGDSNAVQIRWNESTDKWEFTNDGTNYSTVAGIESPTFTGTVTIPAGASISGYAPTANPTFTGTVTVAANGVAFTDGTQTKAGVPSITAFATEITSSATLAAGEADKFVPLNGAVQITLPATGYSTGQSIDFWQSTGTGASFASTNGVVGTPGRNFRTTNSVVTAMKTATGWLIFGDLSA
jgi:hypothetical protein